MCAGSRLGRNKQNGALTHAEKVPREGVVNTWGEDGERLRLR